jgi:beta-glucanase (GH16 family)
VRPSGFRRGLGSAALVLIALGTSACSAPGPSPARTGPAASSSRAPSAAWTVQFDGPAGAPPDPQLLQPLVGDNGAGNHELEAYTDSAANFALDGRGDLALTARRQQVRAADGTTRQWTSARLATKGRWSFRYGVLTARILTPVGQGLWPAFWLLGTDIDQVGWPAAGEIDVMESFNDGLSVYSSLHGPTVTGKPWGLSRSTRRSPIAARQLHDYSVERRPGRITFRIDGRATAVLTPRDLRPGQRWVFDSPMFVLVNLAVGGDWPKNPDASTPGTAAMLIDSLSYTP